jgi:hypothetical protein
MNDKRWRVGVGLAGFAAAAMVGAACAQISGISQYIDCPQDPSCPSCTNGKKDGDETDVDCGGGCKPCASGLGCAAGGDCATGICTGGKCAEPACGDGEQDADETDVDCGGAGCAKCADGKGCKVPADCASGVCGGGKCAAPACDDGAKNGDETDVDCGGPKCGPCGFGMLCGSGTDCTTGFCSATKVCDAKAVVSGLTNPNSLAVDDWGVYWADGDEGTVNQLDFATMSRGQLASGRSGPQGLVIEAGASGAPSQLSWVEPAAGNVVGIGTQALGGSAYAFGFQQDHPAAVAIAPGHNGTQGPFWIANGGVWSYYITEQQAFSFAGQGDRLVILPGGKPDCYALVYAWEVTGGTLTSADYPKGCDPSASGYSFTGIQVGGLVADATTVYWTETTGAVKRWDVGTFGSPAIIAPGQDHPADVVVDGAVVYWINQGSAAGAGQVMKAPSTGGAVTALATGQDTPRGLFVHGSDAYWISGAKGQSAIKKVPK